MNDGIGLEVWKPLLGPLTLEAWVAVDDFWQRRITPERFGRYVETGEPTSRSES